MKVVILRLWTRLLDLRQIMLQRVDLGLEIVGVAIFVARVVRVAPATTEWRRGNADQFLPQFFARNLEAGEVVARRFFQRGDDRVVIVDILGLRKWWQVRAVTIEPRDSDLPFLQV